MPVGNGDLQQAGSSVLFTDTLRSSLVCSTTKLLAVFQGVHLSQATTFVGAVPLT